MQINNVSLTGKLSCMGQRKSCDSASGWSNCSVHFLSLHGEIAFIGWRN